MVTEACKKNHVTVNEVAKPSGGFATDKITFRKIKLRKLLLF
jgi:hypothetical protein